MKFESILILILSVALLLAIAFYFYTQDFINQQTKEQSHETQSSYRSY